MNITGFFKKISGKPASVGAVLAVLFGLLLSGTEFGGLRDIYVNKSYDWFYHFGSHDPGTNVVLLTMNLANRDIERERREHTELLKRLHADGAKLVVFDVLFESLTTNGTDERLAAAMRENGCVILTAFATNASPVGKRAVEGFSIEKPHPMFLEAAAGFGVGKSDAWTGEVARRHWPFEQPGDGQARSLGWVAAELFCHTNFSRDLDHQWLRYYGEHYFGPDSLVPYAEALGKTNGFFRDKAVFIGGWPLLPNDPGYPEEDKFSTPYTLHKGGQAVGGVVINATTFLNLVKGDWLRREPVFVDFFLIVISGVLLGGGLCRLKSVIALLLAAFGIFFAVMCSFYIWSFYTNYWFPWLIIAGGQLPLAVAYAWAVARPAKVVSEQHPGYVEISGSFGEGSFGNVRVVRSDTGQLQALKEVVRAKFLERHGNADAFEREFEGVKKYKPYSAQHPGLLHIDYVKRNDEEGFYFYVMELGDAMDPGWEKNGRPYKPRDLDNHYKSMTDGRLPVRETVRIGITLLEALDFLHRNELVHGDIKPANIIFVKDCPKLADVGLVRDINAGSTFSGTPGFMPPPPEPNGTRAADIYAMGKVLYVISTGLKAETFSSISSTLVEDPEFMLLNEVFCRACNPVARERYPSAREMREALRAVLDELDAGGTRRM